MSKLDEQLKKIKLWQEECKLVVMVIGAVTSTALFFHKLFSGSLVKPEDVSVAPLGIVGKGIGGGGAIAADIAPTVVVAAHPFNWVLVLVAIIAVMFIGMSIWYFAKVMHKHMSKVDNNAQGSSKPN